MSSDSGVAPEARGDATKHMIDVALDVMRFLKAARYEFNSDYGQAAALFMRLDEAIHACELAAPSVATPPDQQKELAEARLQIQALRQERDTAQDEAWENWRSFKRAKAEAVATPPAVDFQKWADFLEKWVDFNRGKGTSHEAWEAFQQHPENPYE